MNTTKYPVVNYLLQEAHDNDYSNVILTTENQYYKKDGGWQSLQVDEALMSSLSNELLDIYKIEKNKYGGRKKAYDFSYELPTTPSKRFRGNISQDMNKISAVFRPIQSAIPSLADMYMPSSLYEIMKKKRGLIIVSGPTDSGKSTLLAALLDYVNCNASRHIITIEDPIEYIFQSGESIINQYEIGDTLETFSDGLLAALRQAPDIIMVGELRDRKSIETALRAAETGHLVLSTIHAGTIPEVADRLKQYFPGDMQQQIQQQFANCFQAVIVQQLLPAKSGGRVAAQEIMLRDHATVNMIRTGRYMLETTLRATDGMQTMEDALEELRAAGLI